MKGLLVTTGEFKYLKYNFNARRLLSKPVFSFFQVAQSFTVY